MIVGVYSFLNQIAKSRFQETVSVYVTIIVSLLHITRSSRMNACNEIIWIAIPPSAAVSNTALWELGYRRR